MTSTPMRRSEYRGPIVWLGGAAVACVAIGLLFGAVSPLLFPPRLQSEVIIQAIPFVGIFAAIILVFILAITLASLRFRRQVPTRTHRPVEWLTIFGILLGIVALFQPWHKGPYTFGFGLVLLSTLAYIFWSHVEPLGPRASAQLPPHTRRAGLLGAAAGGLLAGAVFWMLSVAALPEPPYGMFARQYQRLSEVEQQEVAAQALAEYRYAYLPFLAIYSAIPGLIAFYLVREGVTGATRRPDDGGPGAPVAEGGASSPA